MTRGPALTVVTVTREDLAGLRRTVAGLAAQTCREVQHVVVDAASDDGSADWVRQHPAFRETVLLSEPDRGIYQAMNKGLGLARGQLIIFLNSGDLLAAPDVLAQALASHREHGWQWAYGQSERVDEEGRLLRARATSGRYSWAQQAWWHYDIPQQSVFMRTDLVRDLGGFDERLAIAGDYRLVLAAGRRHRPYVLPWLVARVLAGGVSDRRRAAALREAHQVRADLLSLRGAGRWADAGWTGIMAVKATAMQAWRR